MKVILGTVHGSNVSGKCSPDKSVLRDTTCPAVLTENLFQDNKKNVEYLLSEKDKKEICDLHVDGIVNFLEKYDL